MINAILILVTSNQFEGVYFESPGGAQEFTVMPVVFASIVAIALGGVLLAVLDRFTKRPITIWRWVAIVFLVISLAQPFVFLEGDNVTIAPRIILIIMHIVAGGLTIYLLTTRTQKSE